MIEKLRYQLADKQTRGEVVLKLIEQLTINRGLVNETDDHHNTLLHYAAKYDGTDKLIKILVEKGADLKAKNYQGNTPLHIAAANSIQNSILLMQLGAKDNVINNEVYLPEDVFHQKFPHLSWFDIMPAPKVIFKGNRYYSQPSQHQRC